MSDASALPTARRAAAKLAVDRAVLNTQPFAMLYNASPFFASFPLTPAGDSASSLTVHALANPLKSASRAVAWLVPEDPSELSRNGTNPKTLIDLIPLTRHLGFALQNAPASLSAAVRRKRHSRQRPGGR